MTATARTAAATALAIGCLIALFTSTPAVAQELLDTAAAADDYRAWKRVDSVLSKVEDRPRWVDESASSPFQVREHGALRVGVREPGPTGALVGYSALEPDSDAALADARQSVARQLGALALWLQRDVAASFAREHGLDELLTLAERVASEHLADIERQRFEEAVERDFGRVFRAAVLVDADGEALARLAVSTTEAIATADHDRVVRERVRYWKIGIAGCLSVVAVIAYLALNAMTKGYATGRLRFALVLVVGGLWAVALLLPYPLP